MNFEEFKKRYIEKFTASGQFTKEEVENDDQLQEHIMAIYMGLLVFSEYQQEEMEKVIKLQEKANKDAKKARQVIAKGKESKE